MIGKGMMIVGSNNDRNNWKEPEVSTEYEDTDLRPEAVLSTTMV